VLAAGVGLRRALERGATLDQVVDSPLLAELRRARYWAGDDVASRLVELTGRLETFEPEVAR
jgi:hypothetical protein